MAAMGNAVRSALALALVCACGDGDGGGAGDADAAVAVADAAGPSDAVAPDATPTAGPTVSIGSPAPDVVNAAGTATFAIEYANADTVNLTAGDVTVSNGGGDAACATVAVRDGATSAPLVDVSGCTGDGAVAIAIAPGTAVDVGGTGDPGAGPGPALAVDNTPPTVRIGAPSPVLSEAPGPFSYTVHYDGADTVSLADGDVIARSLTGSATCATRAVTNGDTATPTVALSDCANPGALRLDIVAGTASDRAGNLAPAPAPGPSVAVLPPAATLPIVGHLGGLGQDVAVSGTTACVAKGLKGVECWDVSTPSAPVAISGFDTGGDAVGIALSGDTAYVTDSRWGLVIVDRAAAGGPTVRGLHGPAATFGKLPRRVALDGDLAYVANGANTHVVDVSDPAVPTLVADLPSSDTARDVAVGAGLVVVADGDGGMSVWDVSDPFAPVSLPGIAGPGFARGVALAGTRAYLAAGTGLSVIDVAVSPPALIGRFEEIANTHKEVDVLGDHAYVMASFGLNVYDASTPSSPVPTVERLVGETGAIAGGHAYVSGDMQSLRVYDASAPAAPVTVFARRTLGNVLAVAAVGTTAYVATEGNDVAIVDASTPSAPAIAAEAFTPGRPRDMHIVGDVMYVADEFEGLAIVDISNPLAPALLSSTDFGSLADAFGVTVDGNHVFVAARQRGLVIVDASTPTAPSVVIEVDTPGRAEYVALGNGHAYVADNASGVAIIDVSVPASASLVGSFLTSVNAQGVAVSGDLLAVGTLQDGVFLYDISAPALPVLLGSYTDASGLRLEIVGTRLYVANGNAGGYVLDISDPTAPALADTASHGGPVWDVAVAGDHAFFGEGENGLVVTDAM